MRKITSVFLMICMCVAITACGNEVVTNTDAENNNSAATTDKNEIEEQTGEAQTDGIQTDETQDSSKTLVVYFSATGNTKAIAEKLADGLSADIYEIVPETPYTAADLDYNDNNSRSTIEMNDPAARPAITGTIENFEQYDTIYIGFALWWGQAPRIMSTFVESYDFNGKTVIPFCTSASSGIGSSGTGLAEVAGTGNWLDGKRFSGSEAQDEVMEWANGL